jgi:hypothetical protein
MTPDPIVGLPVCKHPVPLFVAKIAKLQKRKTPAYASHTSAEPIEAACRTVMLNSSSDTPRISRSLPRRYSTRYVCKARRAQRDDSRQACVDRPREKGASTREAACGRRGPNAAGVLAPLPPEYG